MRRARAFLAALALGLLAATAGQAHEVRPAYLEIHQDAPERFVVTWKQPIMGDVAIRLEPRLSNDWLNRPPAEDFISPAYRIRTWRIAKANPQALAGQTLRVDGLERTITDVLVSVRLVDGRAFDTILKADAPTVRLSLARRAGLAVAAYFRLGVEHILTGVDHLMFVLGLLLLVGIGWRLVKAITAFTVAHSLTLAASAVGLARVPSAVVEALVALSIVFVASELMNARRGQGGITARWPWLIAFAFGLLHGFAFAGALAEVGLPRDAVPAALFLFNVGVEAGQLLFVAGAILTILALRPLRLRLSVRLDRLGQALAPYAIGSFAAFWFIERAAAAFA
ncbi:MAG TPA: HupE/UreJ family protein [Phenylobacterium sp.]|uniref:HupE/UreJ family protein n=1 Tax=Phenylobacterium sp. TaxID=1871053 RepID=UPI002B48A137|nr:HupE/UreJ family protein [Phenylobacterium sp.]HKR87637.1 HupE/UreJ family protein [Phenylobacterium sp.]